MYSPLRNGLLFAALALAAVALPAASQSLEELDARLRQHPSIEALHSTS